MKPCVVDCAVRMYDTAVLPCLTTSRITEISNVDVFGALVQARVLVQRSGFLFITDHLEAISNPGL